MLIFIYVFLVYSATILHTSCVVHDIYWRDYVPGDIPCDAYQGAPGKYIGQVNINSNNLPATILIHSHTAVAELGGKQTVKQDIKILCSPNNDRFYWEFVDLDKFEDLQYQDAVKGGFESENHLQVYIGKVSHERDWKIGKAFIPEGLWVWNAEDKAVNFHQFFLLKYNRTDCCRQQRIV